MSKFLSAIMELGDPGTGKPLQKTLSYKGQSFDFCCRSVGMYEDIHWQRIARTLADKYVPLLGADGKSVAMKDGKPVKPGIPIIGYGSPFYANDSMCELAAVFQFAWEGEDKPDEIELFALMRHDELYYQMLEFSGEVRGLIEAQDEGGIDASPLSKDVSETG